MLYRHLTALALLGMMLLTAPATAQTSRDPSFDLVNRGTVKLSELYVTPAGDGNWGKNRLRGKPVAPGATFQVQRRADGNCVLDIKAVFADGRIEERRGMNTCVIDTVAVGGPEQDVTRKHHDDPSFRLINRGDQPITELYATPDGLPGWGQNRLQSGGLPAGTAVLVHIARTADDCLFDLRVVFADHKVLEKRRADLCRITDLPVP
jgi:hypothetical protein